VGLRQKLFKKISLKYFILIFISKIEYMNFVFDATKPIALGADHAGIDFKNIISAWLQEKGYTTKDFGTYTTDSVDYPDFAHPTATSVETGETAFGILFCGSANGVAMTANKHAGIRAGLCWQTDVAELTRLHNDANIICIPARYVSIELTKEMIEKFMSTAFEGGRHQNRVNKITCA
jgi:ribose 5-phosphate isomerase B